LLVKGINCSRLVFVLITNAYNDCNMLNPLNSIFLFCKITSFD
jgi:hypothetical protein